MSTQNLFAVRKLTAINQTAILGDQPMPGSQQASLAIAILYVEGAAEKGRSFYDHVFSWTKTVDEPVYVEYEVGPGVRVGLMPHPHAKFLG